MSYVDSTPNRPNANRGDTDILSEAQSRWDRAYDREKDNQALAYEDLEFLSGDQWPDGERKKRADKGRPILQDNRLPQFVHQITGDIRQLRAAIKVVPVDDEGDEDLAELRAGMVRYIENRSDASAVYFRAADSQVAAGIGHWRVITEYDDALTFNQEIRIAPIEDGVGVLWDPDSQLPQKEDANWCFVPIDMTRAAFEEAFPEATASSFADANWVHNSRWVTDDYVRVAEYWLKKPKKLKLALQIDGSVADITEAEDAVIEFYRLKGARIEDRESYQICRYLITASEVLEGPIEWPGRHIPIVPVLGEETRIGRKIVRNGIVRNAKDPQRLVNYFHTAHAETVALQPKAPFMVTEVNVSKYQDAWEKANTENFPYLPYIPDSKNGGAAPQRIQPPVSSQGVIEGLSLAVESMKAVTGIYDASLGQRGNETSGKAILARQREGDVGSFLYIDNFTRAIRRTGQILIDLIPKIYDVQRTIRIMGEDGKMEVIEINKANGVDPATGETIYKNDLSVGAYDVIATVGPSYTTKREEARQSMVDFMRTVPEIGPLIIDLVAKAQDWPMADEIAERARLTLPPKFRMIDQLKKQGLSDEDIDQAMMQMDQQQQQQGPPPDPEKVAKAQGQAQKNQLDAAKGQQDIVHAQQMAEIDTRMKMLDEAIKNVNLMIQTAKLDQMNNQPVKYREIQ